MLDRELEPGPPRGAWGRGALKCGWLIAAALIAFGFRAFWFSTVPSLRVIVFGVGCYVLIGILRLVVWAVRAARDPS